MKYGPNFVSTANCLSDYTCFIAATARTRVIREEQTKIKPRGKKLRFEGGGKKGQARGETNELRSANCWFTAGRSSVTCARKDPCRRSLVNSARPDELDLDPGVMGPGKRRLGSYAGDAGYSREKGVRFFFFFVGGMSIGVFTRIVALDASTCQTRGVHLYWSLYDYCRSDGRLTR